MDNGWMIEMIGYVGSALVVVSMLMTSVVRLRIVNTVGSLIFMCYALIIGSYPTALMNLCLIGINLTQLFRLLRDRKQYDLFRTDLDDAFVSYFLEKNGEDIRTWFPDFSERDLKADIVLIVCCGSQPAGIFIGDRIGQDEIGILLDYTTPPYRDTSAGRFLYSRLREQGTAKLVFAARAPRHVAYMEKVGYRKGSDGSYVLTL